MKRRKFIKGTGLGLSALAGSSILTACAKQEPYKFWLDGNYPPVSEQVTETSLKVEGSLPPELNGLYVRNGTNASTGPSDHFFGGDGMLHGIRLENGAAKWYRNRYVDTPVYRQETSGFGAPKPEDTTSAVSLIYHGGKLLSLGEFGYPYEINPEDMSTVGFHNYQGKLSGNMTAHPRIDPETGEMIAFGYNVTRPYVTYMRIDAAGNMLQVEPIDTDGPAMMHDFAVTKDYVVFLETKVLFSWFQVITGDGLPFRWDDDAACRFGVMPRKGTNADVRWFDIPSCFIFHVMNSFQENQQIHVDAARYEKLWVKDSHDFNHPAHLSRFTLDLNSGKSSVTRLFERPMEFPQVNRSHWTRPYRYGYSLITDVDGRPFGELTSETAKGYMKYDLRTGETLTLEVAEQYAPGEAVFVSANGQASSEDHGYLLSYVYDSATVLSALWVMDATKLAQGPIAKVPLPVRVPQGFHGLWVPASEYA